MSILDNYDDFCRRQRYNQLPPPQVERAISSQYLYVLHQKYKAISGNLNMPSDKKAALLAELLEDFEVVGHEMLDDLSVSID